MVLVSICVEYNLSESESLSLNCVFISRDVLYTDLLRQESDSSFLSAVSVLMVAAGAVISWPIWLIKCWYKWLSFSWLYVISSAVMVYLFDEINRYFPQHLPNVLPRSLSIELFRSVMLIVKGMIQRGPVIARLILCKCSQRHGISHQMAQYGMFVVCLIYSLTYSMVCILLQY